MEDKTTLRLKAKSVRKLLGIPKVSEQLIELLKSDIFYKTAKNVMIFYPTKFEVNLLSLLEDDKNFYLPRVCGTDLEVCSYKKSDDLEKSFFNILEPKTKAVNPAVLDLVIVPALMADKNGYRLGYGGGFYDRFLTINGNKFKTIVLIPKELFVENLPVDDFDIPVDKVLYA